MTDRQALAALFARHSYREGSFVLSSGATSSFYLDAKQVTYRPDGGVLVGEAVLAFMREFNADAVGGMTMGADAIVMSTVLASAGTSRPVTGFVVRKSPKAHGLAKWIEGIRPEGQRVAIVDDVITSGKSALDAADRAREAGATVAVIIGLVDREEGGGAAVEKTGVPFRAACTLTEVRAQFASVSATR